MDIYNYVDNYGIYSFDEKEINEVDVIIFTYLSYINFKNVLNKNKVTINEAARTHIGLHKKNEANVLAVEDAKKLLYYIKDTKRYRNCILYNYKCIEDDDIQFGVLTIEYQKDKIFISYEGTNEQISGWKENLILSYNYPTRSHIKAIDYLNHYNTLSRKKIILGGHSKGGNLALVAAMNSNFLVKSRIEHIYNVDGPGLLEKQYNSNKFKKIIPKYTHIIPDDSMIGILLYSTNYITVKSNVTGPLAHHVFNWEINNEKFKREHLSSFSKELQIKIKQFVKETDKEDLENIVNNFTFVCKSAGVKTLLDIKLNNKKILDLAYASRIMDKESKKKLFEFINMIVKTYGDSIYTDFQAYLKKLKIEIKNGIK